MPEPAYIALGDDGHVTLYWGDGTEPEQQIIWHGPRPANNQDLVAIIEELKAWAEANGYLVVVPAYDPELPDVEIAVSEEEVEEINLDEVDDLLDTLYLAGDYDEYDPGGDTSGGEADVPDNWY
ncbi:MAG: hypothetical protein GXY36_04480 [Chloroflexi bacterium]|nr:hypothetical protein [Chloroflexota bacterium]